MAHSSILIVEDDPMQRQMLTTLVRRKLDFDSQSAANGREALDILENGPPEAVKLIILDLEMPVMGGMETLGILRQRYPAIPVIMLTGSKNIEDAVQAMKLGAADFLNKPYAGDRIAVTIQNALKISVLSKELSRLKSEKDGTFIFENLIGYDGGLLPAIQIGRKAAPSDLPVLITGETGTGKEVFARAIHGESHRNGHPFIAVNCGAIPLQLAESTLFGHEKGAFTGATEKTTGKFREAEGGTIFLDEIGELPLDTQVKLLRVLQQKEVEPVGANRPIPVNVRVISATNKDLRKEVAKRRFREDLFFRLNVLQVEMPPLRSRRQDIPALADHFIERFCANEGGIPKELSPYTKEALLAYSWPGNVRQLENVMNRAMLLSEGNVLKIKDLPGLASSSDIRSTPATNTISSLKAKDISEEALLEKDMLSIQVIRRNGFFKTLDTIEREAMEIALEHFDRNITQAAKALGIAKSTFYKKMKSL